MYNCASCKGHGCYENDESKMMKVCPTKDRETVEESRELYMDEEDRMIAHNAAEVEAEGYCNWTRIKEIIEFAKKCGYKKLGLAFCIGLSREAEVARNIFRDHGFEVVSVVCKNGSIPKSEIGIEKGDTVRKEPDEEKMCNPIGQALFLNKEKTDLNILFGLCVGHDTLAIKHMEAPVTVLVVKDRVTGHNPIASIYNAKSYFEKRLTPENK